MGQAKQRGTYEQRKQQAVALKKADHAMADRSRPYSSYRVRLAYLIGMASGLTYMDPRKDRDPKK